MDHFCFRHQVEQLAGQMRAATVTGGTEIQFTRLGLRQLDQILHRVHRQRRIDHQDLRSGGSQRDRRQVALRIIGQFFVQTRIDTEGTADQQHRITVGSCARHQLCRQHTATAAAAIVDDKLLAELLGQFTRDHARHKVGVAAGRLGNDESHRPCRVCAGARIGSRRNTARERNRGCGNCHQQPACAVVNH